MKPRKKQFLRNENLESLLTELNETLAPIQDKMNQRFHTPRYPIVLLVGCARSGSTLMMQWLANTGEFAYPTNFLSRFYSSPYVGAKIQQMLIDPEFQYKTEFSDVERHLLYTSELGKTSGMFSPNEFYYFWRRFFKYGDIQHLTVRQLEKVNVKTFRSELASLVTVFDKPLAMKGHIINWNISFISKILPHAIFVHIKRDPVFNGQSLIEAREKFFGDPHEWYSFKPVEYPTLKDLGPYEQVAGQVYFTNCAVEAELSKIQETNQLVITYEEFCKHPEKIFELIKERLAFHGYDRLSHYRGPIRFTSTNKARLEKNQLRLIANAYEQFQGNSK